MHRFLNRLLKEIFPFKYIDHGEFLKIHNFMMNLNLSNMDKYSNDKYNQQTEVL